jgi:hypothetical protein
MTNVITDSGVADVAGRTDGDSLWLASSDVERATGWEPKPEGLCRGDVCVPLRDSFAREGQIDVAEFWRFTRRQVVRDEAGSAWMLASGSSDRRQALESLQAPDFTLPDMHGVNHTLSAYRGKKVFLSTWASW